MKKIYKSLLLLSLCSLPIACSHNEAEFSADFEPIGEIITMSRIFTVSVTRGDNIPPANDTLRLDVTFDDGNERIVNFQVVRIENDIATDLAISREELDQILIDALGEDFMDLDALAAAKSEAAGKTSMSDCLSGCYEKFTDENGNKMPGRGNCKLGCWVNKVAEILAIVAPIIPWFFI